MSQRFLFLSSQKAHCQLHTSAFRPEQAVTTAIQAFCRRGDISRARKLFDEMPDKNVFSFSSLIYGYASNGVYSESLFLFLQMQQSKICPNTYTFVAVLLASAGLRILKFTEYIHGKIIKTGLESHSFIRTALLNTYSKCGAATDAYRFFKQIDMPALVSWNAMISGFVHNGLFEESFLLFEHLREAGIMPNCITMMNVTQSCIGLCSLGICESIHGYVIKTGFDSDVALMNSLLDMYSRCGSLDVARAFFIKMSTKDVITWTNMMGFMVDLAFPTEALYLFTQMRACGIDADTVTMINVISACTLLGNLAKGMSAHGQIVAHGFVSELPATNSLITMYSQCGALESAWMLFNEITHKNLVSWTAMMSGCVCNGKPNDGLHLLISMRREEPFNPDSVTLICSLASSSELSSLELCKQLHVYSLKSGLMLCIDVQNSLVAAYGRCGYSGLALRVFKEMIHIDIVSWNAMLSSYAINGDGQTALALFKEMERCGEKPDSVTFVNVLNACSHSGMVDEGSLLFEKMLDRRIRPRREHYGCLVDMLARAGRLDDARKFADLMPEEFASSIWKALLGGCHINIDCKIAEVAAKRVFEISSGNARHVILLSNVYASVGRFDHVESLRTRIGNNGLVKKPGVSAVDTVPNG